MPEVSIFLDREDSKLVEEEERNLFIRGILEQLGVPDEMLADVWPEEGLTVESKLKLRDFLYKLEIDIIFSTDREVEIFNGDDLLAKWFKPRFILREDKGARTLSKKLYYEMAVKTESVFDQENYDNESDTD